MSELINPDIGAVRTTTDILQTKDYTIFKLLKGNRPADKAHVKRIAKNMLEVGNLTAEFPIVVNEYMEIIDGQHRVEALKSLGWPIAYRKVNGLTLDTVRGINQAAQNWSWKDYAGSFVNDGNDEQKIQYRQFLQLADTFKTDYATTLMYCDLSADRNRRARISFKLGELIIPNYGRAYKLLEQYKEISTAIDFDSSGFAAACYKAMNNADYDHKRMVYKATVYDLPVKKQATVEDYLRFIETVYNRNQPEDSRVRLY
jgi:hypothetical protein